MSVCKQAIKMMGYWFQVSYECHTSALLTTNSLDLCVCYPMLYEQHVLSFITFEAIDWSLRLEDRSQNASVC